MQRQTDLLKDAREQASPMEQGGNSLAAMMTHVPSHQLERTQNVSIESLETMDF